MKGQACRSVSCGGSVVSLGGVPGPDLAAFDALAVKLICLDSGFAAPLRQMGQTLGKRIASDIARPVAFEAALSSMISACGLQGAIESRVFQRDANGARLQITGCAEALGWQVPRVERAVCGFDVGLFEGFPCGATGESWVVDESACLGMGHPFCEFVIQRSEKWKEARHDCR